MEIRDPIHGTLELSDPEVALLESPAYQRLRAIKQLGFAEFSFPGATHNRFLHSIGVSHLAGVAFENVFRAWEFSSNKVRDRLRTVLRLAALLHDIGHGPLSHTTEEVMPKVGQLGLKLKAGDNPDRQANHEDYTLKFLLESSLAQTLREEFPDLKPDHVAALIDKARPSTDDFFIDRDFDFRTVLSQLVSSEMDVDRMDYLERDAYFCGTNYGKVELNWLMSNLTVHPVENKLHLALNRRALYTFDDFLLARHNMHLMVYFHHKAIIYEELLNRYFTSKDCSFFLPADIEEYIRCTDYALYQHLDKVDNEWARRISERRPYRMLFELHTAGNTARPIEMQKGLEKEGIKVIHSSSQARLSKYHSSSQQERAQTIFVVDQYDHRAQPFPLQEGTQIFAKYEEIRQIDRLYVPPEQHSKASEILKSARL